MEFSQSTVGSHPAALAAWHWVYTASVRQISAVLVFKTSLDSPVVCWLMSGVHSILPGSSQADGEDGAWTPGATPSDDINRAPGPSLWSGWSTVGRQLNKGRIRVNGHSRQLWGSVPSLLWFSHLANPLWGQRYNSTPCPPLVQHTSWLIRQFPYGNMQWFSTFPALPSTVTL